jgi:hypothetical protein
VRDRAPFQRHDLEELDERLLSRARRVVPMYDIARGDIGRETIGLRHDVDDNPGSLTTALRMAEWECERGYSSTYFLLHGSYYWDEVIRAAPALEELGHEVGIHVNALAAALRLRTDPHAILAEALGELRSTGVRVVGCVAHGDNLCHSIGFVNDELFLESPRPDWGAPDRELRHAGIRLPIRPRSRRVYGLLYDANWLPRGNYLSDSSGRWSQPFASVVERFGVGGQLHVLVHPDWWTEAFAREVVG